MDVWNTFRNQIATLWRQWTLQQRIGISAAAAFCLIAVAGTLVWATQPEYVLIAKDLSLSEGFEIKGVLETEQIDAELSFSGRAISVPRADVSRARLALRDILEPSSQTEASGGNMFLGSPEAESDQRLRSQELRLAKSIEKISGIRSATIHISRPDPSPFVTDQAPTRASIKIDPVSNDRVSKQVAQSVMLLVAHSVEGLTLDDIALIDTKGHTYSGSEGIGSDMSGQFQFRQQLEFYLVHKAQSALASVLGDGRSNVQLTADIDFRDVSRTTKTVDPELKAKLEETTESEKSEGGNRLVGGIAGADPNILGGPEAAAATSNGGTYKKESTTTIYDNASTNETIREPRGAVKRLTVIASVDLSPSIDAEGNEVASPLTEDDVKSIVQNAVGYDEARGDIVDIVSAPFNVPEPVVETTGFIPLYEEYKPMIEAVLVGMGAMMAFFIAVLSLRKLRPVLVQDESSGGFTREDYQRMAELSQQARENPELAARILSTWLGDDSDTPADPQEVARRSRAA